MILPKYSSNICGLQILAKFFLGGTESHPLPIGSMYGIVTQIWPSMLNVGKYPVPKDPMCQTKNSSLEISPTKQTTLTGGTSRPVCYRDLKTSVASAKIGRFRLCTPPTKNISTTSTVFKGVPIKRKRVMLNWHPATETSETTKNDMEGAGTWRLKQPNKNISVKLNRFPK